MQPIVQGWSMYDMWNQDSIFSVEKIRIRELDQKLYFSGDLSTGYMYNGSGFLSYNLVNNYLEAENNFNGTIFDFINYNGRNYFAGAFSSYLVRDLGSASLGEKEQTEIEIYPNPTIGLLQIKGLNSKTTFHVINLLGQVIADGELETESLDLTKLDNGTYLLKLTFGNKTIVKTFVKN
jgi:hypothetical protein